MLEAGVERSTLPVGMGVDAGLRVMVAWGGFSFSPPPVVSERGGAQSCDASSKANSKLPVLQSSSH